MFSNILQNVNAKDINKAGHSDIARKLISYHIALFMLNPYSENQRLINCRQQIASNFHEAEFVKEFHIIIGIFRLEGTSQCL